MKRTLPLAKVFNATNSPAVEILKDRNYLIKVLDTDGRMKRLVSVRDSLRDRKMENSSEYRKVQERIDEIKLKVIEIMHKYNVIEEAKDFAKNLYEEGIEVIEEKLPETEGKKEVLELLKFAVFREF